MTRFTTASYTRPTTLDIGSPMCEFATLPLTYAEWRAVDCDERLRMVRTMDESMRPTFLALLEWDDCEFLAESAFLSRDAVYRDQVIARLEQLAKGWQSSAVCSYRHAAAMQDAKLGYWARDRT